MDPGPRRTNDGAEDTRDGITPHTRPPADYDADHMLVRTVTCLEGELHLELLCEPAFDHGRTAAEWALVDGSRHAADATGAGVTVRLATDLQLGVEANRVRAQHTLSKGEQAYVTLSWSEELACATSVEDATRGLDATVRYWRRWLGRARPFADHRWREAVQRLDAHDQGPDVHADRRDRRGAHDLASGDARS